MINLVVDEMLLCYPNPNLKQVTQIAMRIVQQYPESFEDRADAGHRIGTGCASLVKQLKCRVEMKHQEIRRCDSECQNPKEELKMMSHRLLQVLHVSQNSQRTAMDA